jgi:D-beta-D-heptose 7-phosphate kinase/D-beta-D-heptose 1-phosphate adenosyltransferase
LELVAGTELKEDSELDPIARDLRQRLSLDWLLVTRGPKGMSLFGYPDARPVKISARAREVFDVSGAGDTVIAALAAMCGGGHELSRQRHPWPTPPPVSSWASWAPNGSGCPNWSRP